MMFCSGSGCEKDQVLRMVFFFTGLSRGRDACALTLRQLRFFFLFLVEGRLVNSYEFGAE